MKKLTILAAIAVLLAPFSTHAFSLESAVSSLIKSLRAQIVVLEADLAACESGNKKTVSAVDESREAKREIAALKVENRILTTFIKRKSLDTPADIARWTKDAAKVLDVDTDKISGNIYDTIHKKAVARIEKNERRIIVLEAEL